MTVVAAHVYREGARLRDIDLGTSSDLPLGRDEFVWIGLHDPNEDELRDLQQRFHLHPLAVEDALVAHQIPKVDVYGNQLFIIAKTAALENDKICYGETDIFVGPNHIITVRHGSARGYKHLRMQLEAAPIHLRHGVDYILHSVLDFIVDGYLPIVEAIEEDVLVMERNALDNFLTREQITRIFHLRRELTRFRRILGPMEEVAARLEHHDMPCIDLEVRPYFRDVLDHVRRVQVLVDGVRDVLGSVFEVSSLLEQQRQGEITRRLASWAAILAVPTAVAGIYGMNFDNMPELRWEYGYPVTIGLILVFCAILFMVFKRAKWL